MYVPRVFIASLSSEQKGGPQPTALRLQTGCDKRVCTLRRTYLKIAALEPWHQAIDEVANVITLNGIGGNPQVVDDLCAQGNLLASVCGSQLGAEQVQLRLRHFA